MIYDFLNHAYKADKTKYNSENKVVDIYTGQGAVYEIRHGKCEQLIDTIKDRSIHAIITDPPFKVGINKDWDMSLPKASFWDKCYNSLKPGGYLVFFGPASRMPQIFNILEQTKFQFRDVIIWNHAPFFPKGYKTQDEAFRSRLRTGYTPVFIYRKHLEGLEEQNWQTYRTNLLSIDACRMKYKGDHSSIIRKFESTGERHHQANTASNTYGDSRGKGWVPNNLGCVPVNTVYCTRPTKSERTINGQIQNLHETVKPLSLMVFLTKLFTNSPEQTVLDPWAGSGTGGMAARYCERKYIGFEMNASHVDLARFRIKHAFELDSKHLHKLKLI